MKITYDPVVDAAYIYIKPQISSGEVKRTYCCDTDETGGVFNLDFDVNGHLLGIEVLDAKKKLPEEVLMEY